MLCEPLPLRPIRSPQLSRTVKSLRGTTTTTTPSSVRRRGEPDVVRRIGRARAEVPGAAARGSRRAPARASASWKAKLAGATKWPSPKISACASSEPVGADLQRVTRAERQHPAGRGAAARDRHHHAVEGGYVELEAAVAPRREQPVEPGVSERLVQLLGVAGPLLGRGLLLEQARPQRVGDRDDVPRRHLDEARLAARGAGDRRSSSFGPSCRPMCVRMTVSASIAFPSGWPVRAPLVPPVRKSTLDGFRR